VFLYEVLSRAVIPFVGCSNVHVVELLLSEHVSQLMHAQFVLPFESARTIYTELILPCWHGKLADRTNFSTLATRCKLLVAQLGAPVRPAFTIADSNWRVGVDGSSSSSGSGSGGGGDGAGVGGGGRKHVPYPAGSSGTSGTSGGSQPTISSNNSRVNKFDGSSGASNFTNELHGHTYKNVKRAEDGAEYSVSSRPPTPGTQLLAISNQHSNGELERSSAGTMLNEESF
jgi:hypothetical protein